jgi:hypothetical protein
MKKKNKYRKTRFHLHGGNLERSRLKPFFLIKKAIAFNIAIKSVSRR